MDGSRRIMKAGGWTLIGGVIAFVLVSSWLSRHFGYPAALHLSASTMLPRLLVGGPTMRGVWAFYSLVPLTLIPAGAAAYVAFERTDRAAMLVGLVALVPGSVCMSLGTMRWAGVHWYLAQVWASAAPETREAIAVFYSATNGYLGTFVGEFLGEIGVGAWLLLTTLTMRRDRRIPAWIAWSGIACAALMLIGAFRGAVGYLPLDLVARPVPWILLLWLALFGVVLIYLTSHRDDAAEAPPDAGAASI